MKKYLSILLAAVLLAVSSGYIFAADKATCCNQPNCACEKGNCCKDGKCACAGECCTKDACQCNNGCQCKKEEPSKCGCQKG